MDPWGPVSTVVERNGIMKKSKKLKKPKRIKPRNPLVPLMRLTRKPGPHKKAGKYPDWKDWELEESESVKRPAISSLSPLVHGAAPSPDFCDSPPPS
jgi:hypothetical protein